MADLRHMVVHINGRETRPPGGLPLMLVCRSRDSVFHVGPARRDRLYYATGDAYKLVDGPRLHRELDVIGWWRSTGGKDIDAV
jgi:hypothetical protein